MFELKKVVYNSSQQISYVPYIEEPSRIVQSSEEHWFIMRLNLGRLGTNQTIGSYYFTFQRIYIQCLAMHTVICPWKQSHLRDCLATRVSKGGGHLS